MKTGIKIRIWDGGKMEYFTLDNDFDCHVGWLENCELMLHAGLTDKNGKDIYEDDICSTSFKEVGIVYKRPGYFGWQGCILGCDELCQEDMILEIIGNIHEHKHLLK